MEEDHQETKQLQFGDVQEKLARLIEESFFDTLANSDPFSIPLLEVTNLPPCQEPPEADPAVSKEGGTAVEDHCQEEQRQQINST